MKKNNKSKTKSYFTTLFNSLAQRDEETNKFSILYDGDEISSPEELKNYFITLICSNVQYDFGINFDKKDVCEMAEALINGK